MLQAKMPTTVKTPATAPRFPKNLKSGKCTQKQRACVEDLPHLNNSLAIAGSRIARVGKLVRECHKTAIRLCRSTEHSHKCGRAKARLPIFRIDYRNSDRTGEGRLRLVNDGTCTRWQRSFGRLDLMKRSNILILRIDRWADLR